MYSKYSVLYYFKKRIKYCIWMQFIHAHESHITLKHFYQNLKAIKLYNVASYI